MADFSVGDKDHFPTRLHPFKASRRATLALAVSGWMLISASFALAGPADSDLRGVTRSEQGAPVPGVKIWVHRIEDNSNINVASDDKGIFLVENLPPGHYQLMASKDGMGCSTLTTVNLAPRQDLRVDMTLATLANPAGASSDLMADSPAPAGSANPDSAPLTPREKALLDRIDRLEQRLAALESRGGKAESASPTLPSTTAVVAAPQPSAAPVTVTSPAPAASPRPVAAAAAPATTPVTAASVATAPAAKPAISSPSANSAAPAPAPPVLTAANTPNGTGLVPITPPPAETAETKTKEIVEPFSDSDWTWLNGNPRTKDVYWDTKFFTPEIRADVTYTWDNQHPADHSMGGSSELFRAGEVQLEQLGIGGDFHWDNVRARFMTQFGSYSTATIRNDGSYTHGEWDIADADRYLSEAYGGYHFNVLNGINVDAGIFMSYIGLFSYYNFDNWAYQPSYVSSNTPWFFQGVRIQIFPTKHLKIEPWFINGWQSYASANNRPGLGGQVKWTPFSWMNIVSNSYGLGHDDLYTPGRARIHTDNSIEIKYFDRPKARFLSKMAFSFTGDLGCEYGGGVSCTGNHAGGPKQSFIGAMVYNRWWFNRDRFAITLGGGGINNPGRYLVLLPPINGETAGSAAINSPYFTENPGDRFKAWDTSLTFDWMPKQYITFRVEPDFRHADVPYWTGPGGITPPAYAGTPSTVVNGNGYPTEYACINGAPSGQTVLSAAQAACGGPSSVWFPSLVKNEFLIDFDIMVKF